MSDRQGSPVLRGLRHAARVPVQAWQLTRRIAGYVLSWDDSRAVYGDDPNGTRDERNIGGSFTANVTGGMGQ
jgi:hypothetical protein